MRTDEWAGKCPMCKGPAYPVHHYAAQVVEVVCETHEDHRYPVELNPLP